MMSSEHLPDAGGGAQESATPNFADIYKEEHPDAVDDPEKARVMAHASDAAEMEGKVARSDAVLALLETKPHVATSDLDGAIVYDEPLAAEEGAEYNTAQAEAARKEADAKAEWAGKTYDRIQATKTSARQDGPADTTPEGDH